MGVSKNNGIPKSSIFIGFSIIFTIHFVFFPPFFGNTPYFCCIFNPAIFQVETTKTTQHGGRQFPGVLKSKAPAGEELPLKVEKRAKGKKAMPPQTLQKGGMTFERFCKNRGKTPKWMVYIYINIYNGKHY